MKNRCRIALLIAASIGALFALPLSNAQAINQVTTGCTTTYDNFYSTTLSTCWANPGSVSTTLYNVWEHSSGNNAGCDNVYIYLSGGYRGYTDIFAKFDVYTFTSPSRTERVDFIYHTANGVASGAACYA